MEMQQTGTAHSQIPLNFKILDHHDKLTQPSIQISPVRHGLINDTYVVSVSTEGGKNGSEIANRKYVLQRINTKVFKQIDTLMSNIEKVCNHLQTKIHSESANVGGTSESTVTSDTPLCLILVYTKQNKPYWEDTSSGECWRMYHHIPNSITYTTPPGDRFLYEAGRAYGRFQRDLSDYPKLESFSATRIEAEDLYETIADFHNTPKRLETFRMAVRNDSFDRARNVRNEICFVESHAHIADVVWSRLADSRLPKRTTHNDTKLENVLFDASTGRALCVVDYDTIMPNGSILYDYGDAIRSMANTAREDENDLNKVSFDLLSFQRFTEGFVEELRAVMTKEEMHLLPIGALLMTFEQAIRFLTDYLMNDVYFKIEYSNHNLDRAKNQLELFKQMLENEKEMIDLVHAINAS